MSRSSISVVIPVYNGARHLERAIASIDAQRWDGPLQVVVVDDGSTDSTPEVIAALGTRVHALRRPNGGPAAARNTGLASTTGELIAFLDADDEWPADKLHHQVAALEADAALDVVLGRVSYIPASGGLVPEIAFEDPERRSVVNVQLGCGVFRRRAFDRVGGFDESLRFSEDHDWFLRAREAGLSLRILDRVTLQYHLHDGNMTREVPVADMLLTTVLKRSLDRRRAGGQPVDLARWRSFDDRHTFAAPAPTVSVIIPTWNNARHVREAIDSVLQHDRPQLEVLVIDDGSTDESVAIAESFGPPVRVLRQGRAGQGSARNHGARLARDEILAFLDADDLWLPTKLSRQIAALTGPDERVDVVFGRVEQFFSPEVGRTDAPIALPDAERRGILPSALACRADTFWRYGGFDERVVIGEFIRWYSTAVDDGARMVFIDDVLVRRRIHLTNTGITYRAERRHLTRSVKEVLDRRRSASRTLQVLVASIRVPTPDFDAASARLEHLLDVLVDQGHAVTFASTRPDSFGELATRSAADEARLRCKGIAIPDERDLRDHLAADGGRYDVVMASYLAPAHLLIEPLASLAPHARTIFDTVDIDHLRLFRTARVTGNRPMLERALAAKGREIAAIGQYDHTFAVSDDERRLLQGLCPGASISVLGIALDVMRADNVAPLAGRRGTVFVGNFLHLPNQDAMVHYVDRRPPPLRIVGGGANPVVDALVGPGAERVGWVDSIASELDRARVFVGPLRFGSGIKGKVVEAMARGLPVVTTSIGAEGLGLVPGRDAFVEDDPDGFAAAVTRLLHDDDLWHRMSLSGLARVRAACSTELFRRQLRVGIDAALARPVRAR